MSYGFSISQLKLVLGNGIENALRFPRRLRHLLFITIVSCEGLLCFLFRVIFYFRFSRGLLFFPFNDFPGELGLLLFFLKCRWNYYGTNIIDHVVKIIFYYNKPKHCYLGCFLKIINNSSPKTRGRSTCFIMKDHEVHNYFFFKCIINYKIFSSSHSFTTVSDFFFKHTFSVSF